MWHDSNALLNKIAPLSTNEGFTGSFAGFYSFMSCHYTVITYYLVSYMQHHVVGISEAPRGSFSHPATQSCILTLSIVHGRLKSTMEKVRIPSSIYNFTCSVNHIKPNCLKSNLENSMNV